MRAVSRPGPLADAPSSAWPAFILSWALLNLLITFDAPFPGQGLRRLLMPSLDVWALVWGICLSKGLGIRGRFVLFVFTAAVVFLRLFSLADRLVPIYLERPFNPYIDSRYLPDLAHLLFHSLGPGAFFGLLFSGIALMAIILFLVWRTLSVCEAFFSEKANRMRFHGLTLAGAAAFAFLSLSPFGGSSIPVAFTAPRIAEELRFVSGLDTHRTDTRAAIEAARIPEAFFKRPFGLLEGRDVHLLVVESYGDTLFSEERHFRSFEPVLRRFGQKIAEKGLHSASGLLESPTFGGASWLAVGTLESGVWLTDELRYDALLESTLSSMAVWFKKAGYHTVSVMPGVTADWPAAAFFKYDRLLYAKDLGYRGPPFGWSPMPDQFVLDRMLRRLPFDGKEPVFVRCALTSTHVPFHWQPPYVADWERIGDGALYHDLPPVTFRMDWPELTQATEGYLRAMDYTFEAVGDYLTRLPGKRVFLVVVGDHQPHARITGPGRPARVPVHLVTDSPEVMAPFLKNGFNEGLVPDPHAEVPRMDGFLGKLLSLTSR